MPALYIHWPFCLQKCPYCDFNSHVREHIPYERFRGALRQELAFEASRLGARPLTSIFFGGGTPSLMEPETVALLIDDAKTYFPPADTLEVTLEANPTSVEAGKLAAFREAGVNRLSLGVQSLDDTALSFLGRGHSAEEALAALTLARRIFPRLSFDMIYARPGQSLPDWDEELGKALDFAADHLSLYQLTIEPGTRFSAMYRQGAFALPDDELAASLYEATAEAAARRGLYAYEVSNYAQPGAESLHNLAYWRYEDFIGIGPGAHGRLSFGDRLVATRRHRAPEIWAGLVEQQGHGGEEEAIGNADRAREALVMGLRLAEGIDAAWFRQRTGLTLEEAVDGAILRACLEEAYLTFDGARLAATPSGRQRLDAILGRLAL